MKQKHETSLKDERYCDRMMEKNGSPKGAQEKTATKIMLIQIQRCLIL